MDRNSDDKIDYEELVQFMREKAIADGQMDRVWMGAAEEEILNRKIVNFLWIEL